MNGTDDKDCESPTRATLVDSFILAKLRSELRADAPSARGVRSSAPVQLNALRFVESTGAVVDTALE